MILTITNKCIEFDKKNTDFRSKVINYNPTHGNEALIEGTLIVQSPRRVRAHKKAEKNK